MQEDLYECFNKVYNLVGLGKENINFLDLEDQIQIEKMLCNTIWEDKKPFFTNPPNQIFKKNQDIVFSGCSQTSGDQISKPIAHDGDFTKIWGFLVSKNMSLDSTNLAESGSSVYSIVNNIFAYIKTYGNPKILLCLLPDLRRATLPIDSNVLTTTPSGSTKNKFVLIASINDKSEYHPSYAKRPFNTSDVIPQVVPNWLSLQHLMILEQYCESNNIKFFYGSWHDQTNDVIKLLNKINEIKNNPLPYKNFIDFSNVDFEMSECSVHDNENASSVFHIGADNLHFGIHKNIHIADIFLKKIKESEA